MSNRKLKIYEYYFLVFEDICRYTSIVFEYDGAKGVEGYINPNEHQGTLSALYDNSNGHQISTPVQWREPDP
jgi:hypothetical protein